MQREIMEPCCLKYMYMYIHVHVHVHTRICLYKVCMYVQHMYMYLMNMYIRNTIYMYSPLVTFVPWFRLIHCLVWTGVAKGKKGSYTCRLPHRCRLLSKIEVNLSLKSQSHDDHTLSVHYPPTIHRKLVWEGHCGGHSIV